MTSSIDQQLRQHFSASKRTSLLREIVETWDPAGLLDGLASSHRAIHRLAFLKLKALRETELFPSIIMRGLSDQRETCRASTLLSLCALLNEDARPDSYRQRVLELLADPHRAVRSGAAQVIAFHFPSDIRFLLDHTAPAEFSAVVRDVCCNNQPEFIPEIVKRFGEQRLPPSLGILIDPFWLASHFELDPDLVSLLASEYGFADVPITHEVVEVWSQGISYVNQAMLDAPADNWGTRTLEFSWSLLPQSFGLDHEETAVDLDCPVDTGLFLSAVREADRSQLQNIQSTNPFDQESRLGARVICCHAKPKFVHELFIEHPLKLARELSIAESAHGRFLVEHAASQLLVDTQERAEAVAILHARWTIRSQQLGLGSVYKFPVTCDDHFPDAKRIVLSRLPDVEDDPRFCPGSQAIVRAAAAAGIDEISDWLFKKEEQWRKFLVPIGIELQVPVMDRNRTLAWKQALRYLGIPSPRRPEYQLMTEAAFRPVPTFHAAIAGPAILFALGMISRPQDTALHLSFQGDLGEDARYLAFPQLFLRSTPRSQNRPSWSISPLMSKGFVHLNQDVEQCDSNQPAECRTELRICRCIVNSHEDKLELCPTYMEDIIANHILASAMLRDHSTTRSQIDDYKQRIENFAEQLGPEFSDLLHANFYESTGDALDADLLEYLPIIRQRNQVRQAFTKRLDRQDVETEFINLRSECVQEICKMWFPDTDQMNTMMKEIQNAQSRLPCFSGLHSSHG